MKRWGWDRTLGLLALYLGPLSFAWTWGPGGVAFSSAWLWPRRKHKAPELRVVDSE